MQFTLSQERAVDHADGPAMVLAGPGSGKTMVIAGRVDRLITKYHVPPGSILVITYTRAAAEEMQSRYLKSAADPQRAVTFSTFHALFYRILREHLHLPSGSVVTGARQAAWIREIVASLPDAPPQERDVIQEILSEIAAVKAHQTELGGYSAHSTDSASFRKICAAYNARLRAERMVDFEDMGLRCEKLIRTEPELLKELREHYRYLLVDEYQDINPQQYRLLKAFAAPANNLMAVGDDDQSIYRFRGASPELMRRFAKEYPQARTYVLDRCFRCSQAILHAALGMVAHNRQRFAKKLRSEKGPGIPPRLYVYEDPEAQDAALLAAIRARLKEGVPPAGIAVLERTRFGLARLARYFERAGLAFCSHETVGGLYSERVSEDVFAYLRLAAGPYRREDLLRILNKPSRYLSRSAFAARRAASAAEELASLRAYYQGRPAQLKALAELENGLRRLHSLRPFAALEYIRHELGYERFLAEQERRSEPGSGRELREQELQILDELAADAAGFPDYARWEAFREESLEKAARKKSEGGAATGQDRAEGISGAAAGADRRAAAGAIRLETMHGAKGLEFDTVFLPDLCDGTLPHRKNRSEEGIEEERRLFYVALTRARNLLWLSYVRRRRAGKEEPSRFLRELGIAAEEGAARAGRRLGG